MRSVQPCVTSFLQQQAAEVAETDAMEIDESAQVPPAAAHPAAKRVAVARDDVAWAPLNSLYEGGGGRPCDSIRVLFEVSYARGTSVRTNKTFVELRCRLCRQVLATATENRTIISQPNRLRSHTKHCSESRLILKESSRRIVSQVWPDVVSVAASRQQRIGGFLGPSADGGVKKAANALLS